MTGIRKLHENENGVSADSQDSEQAPNPKVPRPAIHWKSRLLVPTILFTAGFSLLIVSAQSSLLPVTTVEVEAAVSKVTDSTVAASTQVVAAGWLEAAPYLQHVTALTGGVLLEVNVLEGESVKADTVVAILDDDDAKLALKRSQAMLKLKQAAVAEAHARNEAAESNWKNPVDHDRSVAVSNAQLKEAQAAVSVAQDRLTQQEAVLAQARRDRDRAKKLVETETITRQRGEESQKQFEVAQAERNAIAKTLQQAELTVIRMKARAEAAKRNSDLRISDKRERDAAAAALRRAEAEAEVAEAALAEAELRLKRTRIRTAVDGVVVTRWKEPGDKVMLNGDKNRSATIVSLYDPKKMQARVDVPLADAAKIAIGQRCEIISDVLPNQSFPGKVSRILHAADVQKNTLEVKVALETTSPALRPEMLCRVRFLAGSQTDTGKTSAVFAPSKAVRDGKVWLLRNFDGTYGEARALTLSDETLRRLEQGTIEGWAAVQGLQAGDLVIISSSASLRDGEQVRLKEDS
ncbi:MAG: efflux RND transporter periplasmic adaptor subunit [Planctomycetota bacterium]|jgi:RND family efflux transporter MFP subunit